MNNMNNIYYIIFILTGRSGYSIHTCESNEGIFNHTKR